MLRKTCLAGVISLLFAPTCFSGFYVGAAVGPETARFSQTAHVVRFGSRDIVDKNRFSGVGVFGTIFAGVSVIYKCLYLAAEIHGTMSSVEYKLTNDEFVHQNFSKTTFTMRHNEGVSILPGFLLSPDTALY